MLRDIEKFATDSRLQLSNHGTIWDCASDWPHIATFQYDLAVCEDDSDEFTSVGAVDGYRITQDWTVEHEVDLWDEADALDGDVVRYVEALIRELRACEAVFKHAPDLSTAQRITIVRHVEAKTKAELASLTQGAVACMAMMDAPALMLVDPWPMSAERRSPEGKLSGRQNIQKLLKLGLKRMVGSRFLWGWNAELAESLMSSTRTRTFSRQSVRALSKRF
ncbi:MAG: hypothetical protein ACOY0T_37755 [Myxococcota bacterium]